MVDGMQELEPGQRARDEAADAERRRAANEAERDRIDGPDLNDERGRGLYDKYRVARSDGDPTGKHEGCRYIVLDTTHDRNAPPAIRAYAIAVRRDGFLSLADDLIDIAADAEARLTERPSRQERTDAEHARALLDAVAWLNSAIDAASEAGLVVTVETHEIERIAAVGTTSYVSVGALRPIYPIAP
jgi:hypothetical protein